MDLSHFKELSYMIVGVGKSEIHRAGLDIKLETPAGPDTPVVRQNFFFLRKLSFALTDFQMIGKIHPIIEDSPLIT